MDTTKILSVTLTREIQKIRKENQTFQGHHGEDVQKLAKIFGATADQVASTPTNTTKTSSTPTAPTEICLAPHTNQRVAGEKLQV